MNTLVAFDYDSHEPGDLPLKAGQKVKVTAKVDNEWVYGTSDSGSGIFPALFVTISAGTEALVILDLELSSLTPT